MMVDTELDGLKQRLIENKRFILQIVVFYVHCIYI